MRFLVFTGVKPTGTACTEAGDEQIAHDDPVHLVSQVGCCAPSEWSTHTPRRARRDRARSVLAPPLPLLLLLLLLRVGVFMVGVCRVCVGCRCVVWGGRGRVCFFPDI